MMKYTPVKIFELYQGWQEKMADSFDRGQNNIDFVQFNKQSFSEGGIYQQKEKLRFNVVNKLVGTAKANGRNIELALELLAGQHSAQNTEETKERRAFAGIADAIALSEQNKLAYQKALDQVYDFGQAIFHIKPVREDENTLNEVLAVEAINDPTMAFFDYTAPSPSFHDGQFCGRKYYWKRRDLIKLYRGLKNASLKDDVEIIDFWYKDRKKINYVLTSTGEYKREDRIDPTRDAIIIGKTKPGWATYISYVRCLRDHPTFLEKQLYLPFSWLPMVMDFGNMVWDGKGWQSIPFGFHLMDTQVLMNYAGSTLADILKSSQADKWLFSPEHIKSSAAKKAANEINTREGGMVFTGNISGIRREPTQPLPPTISEFFVNLQQLMQSLAGSYIDGSNDEIKAMSGVALDKMFKRADLVQNNVITSHISTLNIVGEIIRHMMPTYYRQNRTLYIVDSMEGERYIEINKPVQQPNSQIVTVENNIKDIAQNYRFKINAAPSLLLQKQNTQIELSALYQLLPTAISQTIDIYANSLDIRQNEELSRRLGVNIPQPLLDYGHGNINLEEYQQLAAQQAQQAQMQQLQAMQNNPQAQYMTAKAQGEQARAQTAQYQAETARIKEENAATTDHIEAVSKAVKYDMDNKNAEAQRGLEYYKTNKEHQNALIETLD